MKVLSLIDRQTPLIRAGLSDYPDHVSSLPTL